MMIRPCARLPAGGDLPLPDTSSYAEADATAQAASPTGDVRIHQTPRAREPGYPSASSVVGRKRRDSSAAGSRWCGLASANTDRLQAGGSTLERRESPPEAIPESAYGRKGAPMLGACLALRIEATPADPVGSCLLLTLLDRPRPVEQAAIWCRHRFPVGLPIALRPRFAAVA